MVNSPNRFLIWGAGGHGMVVAELIRATGCRVAGFIDHDPAKQGAIAEPGGARVELSEESFLRDYRHTARLPFEASAIALAMGDGTQRAQRRLQIAAEDLPPIVAPNSHISPSATIEPAVIILEEVIVHALTHIGAGCILNTRAVVEHECHLGADVHVSPAAVLCGGVHVGDRSWIGAGSVVIHGIHIGRDCIIGAGAVVIRDVPDRTTVAGIPARPITKPATA